MADLKYKRPANQGCQLALFEWVESYDTKDWDRLSSCLAPTLRIDYRSILNKLWESMPAEQFRAMVSDQKFLGNPRIKTQHLIGAGKWVQTGNDSITGYHQMRVAHQTYKEDKLTEVSKTQHAQGMTTVCYRRVDDVWKWAGLEPDIR